jgi:hypothetical protein
MWIEPINLHAIEVCSVKGLEIVLKGEIDVKMRDILLFAC